MLAGSKHLRPGSHDPGRIDGVEAVVFKPQLKLFGWNFGGQRSAARNWFVARPLNGVGLGRCLTMTRILVVEDENFLAMELAWIVEDAGYSVVGPERSVAETSKMLAWNKVDLALLDINLGGEMVFPISKMLDTLGVPFVFITSNSALVPAEYRHRPLMTKPLRPEALLALILRILTERADALGSAPNPLPSGDHPG